MMKHKFAVGNLIMFMRPVPYSESLNKFGQGPFLVISVEPESRRLDRHYVLLDGELKIENILTQDAKSWHNTRISNLFKF